MTNNISEFYKNNVSDLNMQVENSDYRDFIHTVELKITDEKQSVLIYKHL
jgi:hypothetical protein